MRKNSLKTLRRKANAAGYSIEKGFQHYMYNDSVLPGRKTGYMVLNLSTGYYENGCYDTNFDHLWSIENVENFIKGIYQSNNMAW